MNIKKTIVASLLACMLPAVVMAKDVSIGVSMALFDDNFLTILRTSMQKEMKKDGVKSQIEDAKGDVSQQLQQVQNFIGRGGRHYRQPGGYQRGETDHGSGHQSRDPAGVCEPPSAGGADRQDGLCGIGLHSCRPSADGSAGESDER